MSLEIPYGLKPTNPVPADAWYGPWATLAAAKSGVPLAIRYHGLTVFIIAENAKYIWKDDLTDDGLEPDSIDPPTLGSVIAEDNKALGNIDMVGGFKVVNMPNPTDAGDGANKTYADQKETNAKNYADSLVTSAIRYAGQWSAAGGTFPIVGTGTAGAVRSGDTYDISVAGTISGTTFEVGDTLRATQDVPGQDTSKWAKGQVNSEQASETKVGIARVATDVEAKAKLSDLLIVTPAKLGAVIVEEKKYVNYQIAMTGETEQAVYMENAGNVLDVKFAGCNTVKLKIGTAGTYPVGAQTYPFAYSAGDRVFFTFNYNDLLQAKCNIKLKCKDN